KVDVTHRQSLDVARVEPPGGKRAEHRVLRICVGQLRHRAAVVAPTADHVRAHAFQCHPLHREARQTGDRRGLARARHFDVTQHDVSQQPGSGCRLTATTRTPAQRERAPSVAYAHALDDHVFDVRAVDGLDRYAAGLVQVVQIGHVLVSLVSRPSVEVAVLHEHATYRAARLRPDLEAVRARARQAAKHLDVLGSPWRPEEQARLDADRVVVALHVTVGDTDATARIGIDAVGERVTNGDTL